MTILPNKRTTGANNKESEKSEANNSATNHNNANSRLNRGLLSSSQLLIQDTAPGGINNQNHAHTSYNDDNIGKYRPTHHLLTNSYKEESVSPSSSPTGRQGRRATKRKSREHLEHSTAPKTTVLSKNLTYQQQQTDEQSQPTSSERNNSEDEYEPVEMSNEEWEARDRNFYDLMRKKGFVVKTIEEDGACLFRAIADQVYGNEDMHSTVRHYCMDYIMQNRDFFSEYITEDINRYVSRKRNDFVHGNHLEIQALSEMYNRTIEVYCYSEEPINIFHGHYKHGYEPIRLSYQRGSHYNSIRDPYTASIGVGLGLPNYQPGEADRKLLKDASSANELILIEQAMIQDKIAATDWEATNDAILEQAARESWALYVNDGNLRDPVAGCSSTSSSATCSSTSFASRIANSSFPSSSHRHTIVQRGERCRIPTPPTTRIPSPSTTSSGSGTGGNGGTSGGGNSLHRHRISTPPHSSSRSCHSLPTSPHNSPRLTSASLCPSWPTSPRVHSISSPHSSKIGGLESAPATTSNQINNNGEMKNDSSSLDSNIPNYNSWQYSTFLHNSDEMKNENLCMQMPPEIFGISGWEDDADILAKVLAESQKEYLESLKSSRSTTNAQSNTLWENGDVDKPGPSSSKT